MVRAVVTFYVDYVAVSQGPTLTPITQAFCVYADLTVRHQSASVMGSPLLARRGIRGRRPLSLHGFPGYSRARAYYNTSNGGDLYAAGGRANLGGIRLTDCGQRPQGDVRRSTAWPVGRLSAATGERDRQTIRQLVTRRLGLAYLQRTCPVMHRARPPVSTPPEGIRLRFVPDATFLDAEI